VQDVPKVDEIARYGREYAKQAIAKSAKDPESLHFLEQLGEQWRPEAQVLDVKYRITATNSFGGRVQGMGVASMAYKGGDPYKAENWAVVTAGILE
jgi:hypothetical protein